MISGHVGTNIRTWKQIKQNTERERQIYSMTCLRVLLERFRFCIMLQVRHGCESSSLRQLIRRLLYSWVRILIKRPHYALR